MHPASSRARPPSARRGFGFIVTAATLWGTTGVATEAIYRLGSTNALSIAFLRLVIGTLVLLVLCQVLLGQRIWAIKRRDALLMCCMGAMQAIFQLCYLAAIPESGVTIATLVAICVAPVLVVLYSTLFLRERLTLKTLLALLCALSGTILLSDTPTTAQTSGSLFSGVVLALIAAAAYAATILIGRGLSGRYHTLQVNTVVFGVGSLLLLGGSFTTRLTFHYPFNAWLLILYLGCVPTALAYIFFQSGLRAISATLTSILTLCEPLTAALLAWFLLGERLNLLGLVGALLLLGTILLLAYQIPTANAPQA